MTTHHPTPRKQPADQGWNRGFTLSETIIVVFLVGIVTAIVVTSVQNSIERARMASCMMELRGIQAALWHDSDGGNRTIDPKTFWDTHYRGTKPGPFVLMVDSGSTGGSEPASHGFGAPAEFRPDASFVVVGRYAHWAPGQYVYIEGDQPPQLVTNADMDPGYGEQIDWAAGRQWGASGGDGAALAPDVSWTGSQSNGTHSSPGASGGGGGSAGQSGGAGSTGSTGTSTGSGRNTSSRIGD